MLIYVFTDEHMRSQLDNIFSKYLVIPLTSAIAFLIAHYFHKKNKPVQDFWERKRRDTIYDVSTCINQIQISLRSIEKSIIETSQIPINLIDISFNSEVKKLQKYIILHNQYITNMEARQLELIREYFQNYLNGLSSFGQYSEQQKEQDIITLESVIDRLITGFKTVSANQVKELRKPISDYFTTTEIISSRNRCRHSKQDN